MRWSPVADGIRFRVSTAQLPDPLPAHWRVVGREERSVEVLVNDPFELLLPAERRSEVNAAGQLPAGFDPRALYPARNHPRGLQMTVYGASDALQSLGIDWELVLGLVPPDRISVYAGSGMSQLDAHGNGGMMAARAMGRRVTSKQCPFGFAEMPADFINAYILGSLGNTGTSMGACASFLYNLGQAVSDIRSGHIAAAWMPLRSLPRWRGCVRIRCCVNPPPLPGGAPWMTSSRWRGSARASRSSWLQGRAKQPSCEYVRCAASPDF